MTIVEGEIGYVPFGWRDVWTFFVLRGWEEWFEVVRRGAGEVQDLSLYTTPNLTH